MNENERRQVVEHILGSENRLLERLIFYVKDRGFDKYVPPLIESWRLALSGVSRSIVEGLDSCYPDSELKPDEDYEHDAISRFAKLEAVRHRGRGVTIEMFLSLMVYFRQIYTEIVAEADLRQEAQALACQVVGRFFDRMIISVAKEWSSQEQNQMVADLQKTSRSMTHEKNKYLAIFESHPHMVFLIDKDGHGIDNMNRAAALMFENARLPGSHYYQLEKRNDGSIVPALRISQQAGNGKAERPHIEELIPWIAEDLCVFIDSGQPLCGFERQVTTDKGTRYYSVKMSHILDATGRLQSLILSMEDITSKREAEEELRLAKERAEAANQAKSTFLASMSHELRTPLNAILGFSQLMERDSDLTARQKDNLNTINRAGEHLLGVINDVLEMSKVEAGGVSLNPFAFDLHALLDEVVRMFRLRIEAKGLELCVRSYDNVPRCVVADQAKLRQVLVNLLGNAVKFTEEGSIILRADADTDRSGRWRLLLEVQDSGAGIAEDQLDRVFAPFEQGTGGQSAQEGTGLGLAIARGYVELMGGDIRLSSQVGHGSVFSVDIPIEQGEIGQVAARSEPRRVIGLQPGQARWRILVVDDEKVNRELLVQLLDGAGFETHEAINGEEAICGFERWQPHLVLMDIRMPVLNGLEATRRIKLTEAGKTTPVVAVTAHAFVEEREEVLAAGCDDLVCKPYHENEIFEAMARHLDIRYLYETPGLPQTDELPSVETLTGERVARLPTALLVELRDALAEMRPKRINEVLDRVQEQDAPLSLALRALADDFAYDQLQALLEPSPRAEGGS